jgi:hypothetical protein
MSDRIVSRLSRYAVRNFPPPILQSEKRTKLRPDPVREVAEVVRERAQVKLHQTEQKAGNQEKDAEVIWANTVLRKREITDWIKYWPPDHGHAALVPWRF